jgi:hypothetical protein
VKTYCAIVVGLRAGVLNRLENTARNAMWFLFLWHYQPLKYSFVDSSHPAVVSLAFPFLTRRCRAALYLPLVVWMAMEFFLSTFNKRVSKVVMVILLG